MKPAQQRPQKPEGPLSKETHGTQQSEEPPPSPPILQKPRHPSPAHLTYQRTTWWLSTRLANLTVAQFRDHYIKDWQDLPLGEEDRRALLAVFCDHPALKTDSRFWQVLEQAENMEQWRPGDPEFRAFHWVVKYLREDFPRDYGKPAPPEWPQAAVQVLGTLAQNRQHVRQMWITPRSRSLRERWEQGNKAGLLSAVREGLITEPWVSHAILDLQYRQVAGETVTDQKQAAKLLEQVAMELPRKGQGNRPIPPAIKRQIIADCKKWRPICEGLNEAFKKLWAQSEYESSELYRKEARGSLAERYGISVADVGAIELYLEKPSRRSRKSTPTDAMYHMVARPHIVGKKNVEKIWGEYLDEHPEERRKRRKLPTTPVAGRTA